MKISYEFEGHDLTDWAEFGGLPVWVKMGAWTDEIEARLFAHCPDDNDGDGHPFIAYPEDSKSWNGYDRCRLRYTKLEDIIDKAPEWAEWFYPNLNCGDGYWWYEKEPMKHPDHGTYWNDGTSETMRIEGHLFDPTKYHEPVNFEQFRKDQA